MSPFFPHTITDNLKRDSVHLPSAFGDYRGHAPRNPNRKRIHCIYKHYIFVSHSGDRSAHLIGEWWFSFHLSLFLPQRKKKITRFWQPFCFLIQIRESKLYLKCLNFNVIKPTGNSYLQINDSGQNGSHFVFVQIWNTNPNKTLRKWHLFIQLTETWFKG